MFFVAVFDKIVHCQPLNAHPTSTKRSIRLLMCCSQIDIPGLYSWHDTSGLSFLVVVPVVARRISETARASATGVVIDEPEAARRSPSPARNPVNKVVHLRNLVRPYTILQLQELLRRSGALVDDGFWIDKVKSHCFVTVSKSSSLLRHGQ